MIPLELEWLLAFAAELLELDLRTVETICKVNELDSARMAPFAGFGEYERYPTLGEKCGVLAYRIMRNHPLPDGNKRLAFFAMLALGRLNGADWNLPYEDQVVSIFLAAAPGTMEEETFVAFVDNWLVEP